MGGFKLVEQLHHLTFYHRRCALGKRRKLPKIGQTGRKRHTGCSCGMMMMVQKLPKNSGKRIVPNEIK